MHFLQALLLLFAPFLALAHEGDEIKGLREHGKVKNWDECRSLCMKNEDCHSAAYDTHCTECWMFDCGFSPYLGTSRYEIVLTADSAWQCPERVPRINSTELQPNRICPELTVLSTDGSGGTTTGPGKTNGAGRLVGGSGGLMMAVGLVATML